jgi:hypothetical protein
MVEEQRGRRDDRQDLLRTVLGIERKYSRDITKCLMSVTATTYQNVVIVQWNAYRASEERKTKGSRGQKYTLWKSGVLSTLAHVVSVDLSCPGYVPKGCLSSGNSASSWQSESQSEPQCLERFCDVASL